MPYYTSNGKVYLQDANASNPNVATEVSGAAPGGTYGNNPLPSGLQTVAAAAPSGMVPRYGASAAPDGTSTGFVDSETSGMFAPGGIYADRGAPDQAAIRAQIQQQSQAQIDAINTAADQLVNTENTVNGPNRLGQARALAAKSGLIGSTMYEQGQKPNVVQKNSEAVQAIENDRASKLAAVFNSINSQSTAEYNAKLSQAQGNADAYVKFLQQSESDTRDAVKNLAASGVSWDVLSSDPEYAQELNNILKYGNFSDPTQLEAFFNANKPADQKIQYTTETIKGENGNAWLLRYGMDPVTGKVTTQKSDIGINYETLKGSGKTIQEANGLFYLYDPSAGTLTKIGGTATSTPGGDATGNQKDYSSYVAQETKAGRTPMSFADFLGKGGGGGNTKLSDTQLRNLVVAGIPSDVATGIYNDMAQGFSLNDIRTNLATQFGKDKGFSYLDNFMTTAQKDNSFAALLSALGGSQ